MELYAELSTHQPADDGGAALTVFWHDQGKTSLADTLGTVPLDSTGHPDTATAERLLAAGGWRVTTDWRPGGTGYVVAVTR